MTPLRSISQKRQKNVLNRQKDVANRETFACFELGMRHLYRHLYRHYPQGMRLREVAD